MEYTHVIWDFNGTILDDVKIVIESSNILLKRRNLKPIENTDYHRKNFCFPIINYYKKIGFDFEREDYESIALEWAKEYKAFYHKAKIQDGVKELLNYFDNLNISQALISASEINLLKIQLDELGLSDYFTEILGLSDFNAISKVDVARGWISNTNPKKVLMIGDTTHDYEVATKIGASCILIANGHQDIEVLKKLDCVVAENLNDVINILENML